MSPAPGHASLSSKSSTAGSPNNIPLMILRVLSTRFILFFAAELALPLTLFPGTDGMCMIGFGNLICCVEG